MLEAEAKDNSLRPSLMPRTTFSPRGQLVLEDFTSLVTVTVVAFEYGPWLVLASVLYVISVCYILVTVAWQR